MSVIGKKIIISVFIFKITVYTHTQMYFFYFVSNKNNPELLYTCQSVKCTVPITHTHTYNIVSDSCV